MNRKIINGTGGPGSATIDVEWYSGDTEVTLQTEETEPDGAIVRIRINERNARLLHAALGLFLAEIFR